MNEEQNKKVS